MSYPVKEGGTVLPDRFPHKREEPAGRAGSGVDGKGEKRISLFALWLSNMDAKT